MSLPHEQEVAAECPPALILATPSRPGRASKRRMAVSLMAFLLVLTCLITLTSHIGVSIRQVMQIGTHAVTWQRWMHDHALHFLVWRLALYGVTAGGWIWARRRKLQRFTTQEMAQRMLRTEVFVVAFIVIFEAQKWLRA